MDDSRLAMPCGYTADETYPNTHGGDDPSDDYADVYNAQDGDECEDSHEGYDTSGDWNGEEAAANDAGERNKKWSVEDICRSIVEDIVETCELETVASNVTQDPELCSEIIQDHTASVVKSRRGKGKGNKSGKRTTRPSDLATVDRRRMLADLRTTTPCNHCGQKGHWRPQCPLLLESDSSEDAVKCSYMVVKVEADYQNEDADRLRYDCEPLPLRMKYQQMTFLSVFLRRWCQVTAGNKMLDHMAKVTGGRHDIPMDNSADKGALQANTSAHSST